MLVLTRKKGERICIGDDIVIEVLFAGGGTARLGFSAVPNVKVLRSELLERMLVELPKQGAVEREVVTARQEVNDL